ncbi:MAG: 1,4-dihydroxy-2-naphthoate polyprenyltransferase [Chloroflexi bacterium]|nr:1,4-dihydroxy-2-naphthoate polyprenyltransferase [Chloroflexota bacterium]
MTKRAAWRLAVRVPTLPAAMAAVAVGTGAAIGRDAFELLPALAALFGALCLQIGANFANDVFDFRRGADTPNRLGPPRVTQLGMLSQREVFAGMWLAFGLAFAVGIYLVYVGGWPIVAVGLASILAAIVYTGGPWPIGYHALGDLFTFVFFGLAAVAGTYYVQAGATARLAWVAAVPMGCTVTAILVVNNLRDIPTDRLAGKTTLGVIMGERGTRAWYVFLLAAAYAAAIGSWAFGASPWVLLVLASAWWARVPVRAVTTGARGPALNPILRATARFHLVFGLLFALGLALS